MKIFKSLSVILMCCSSITYAAEFEFVAVDSSIETETCIAAVTDNTEVMISNLKKLSRRGTALSFRSFVNSFSCNQQYIGNFVKTYQAINSSAYLDKYTNEWSKKRHSSITVTDIASEHELKREGTVVVRVRSY